MGFNELSEAGFSAYLSYIVGALFRYVAIAGGIYALCHVVFRQRWVVYRVQERFPAPDELRHAVRWSIANMIFMGLFTMLMCEVIHAGHSAMYFGVGEHGWGYFVLSVVVGIVGYDTWIYWQHRVLHTPWLFRHAHAVHHHATNPTPFSMYAFHPIESVLGNGYYLLLIIFVPLHPMALNLIVLFFMSYGILGHSGYEFFPRGFTRHRLFGWLGSSTHHNMHHSHMDCNYGNWFNYWDRMMGTNHPGYHDYFDAVTARRQNAGSAIGTDAADQSRQSLAQIPAATLADQRAA